MSIMTTLFEKIAGRQRQREKARVMSFRDLVRQIADGQEPDAEAVDRVLVDNGKGLEDLRAAVELLQRRRDMKARVDQIPAIRNEQAEIDKQLGEAFAELEAAQERFDQLNGPMQIRIQQMRDEISEADRAKRQLWDQCPYPELRSQLADIAKRFKDACDRASELRRLIEEQRRMATSRRENAQDAWDKDMKKRLLKGADHREAQAREAEAELPKVEKLIAELERQGDELRNGPMQEP